MARPSWAMSAVLVQEDRTVAVKDHPIGAIPDGNILVKVVAVAQNPTDWKAAAFWGKPGTILGCDWSGRVAAPARDVTTHKPGDHVAGFVQGGTCDGHGAFAEYISTPAELTWIVPANTISHEQAATLGCGFWTSVQALYHPKRLGLVEPPAKVSGEEWLLIYGGSTSVGQYAIQLAHLSGYKVVTTASPRNFELLESLGADAVFDYHDADVVANIKSASGDSIHAAFDTVSEDTSQEICRSALAPGGGKIVLTLRPDPDAKVPDDIEVIPTVIYTALGRTFTMGTTEFPASSEDRAHMAAFLLKVPQLVSEGKITPNKVKLWPGGLNAVSDGLQYMREGKVSAEKIVYKV